MLAAPRVAVLALVLTVAIVAGAAVAAPSPAPALAGTTIEGKRLSSAALRGKPVLVNVWSSW